jgi:hypothetical protein
VFSTYPGDTQSYYSNFNPMRRVPLHDIANSINKEKYYVGFFAARNASYFLTNVTYLEADKTNTAPPLVVIPVPLMPTIEVVSPLFYTGIDTLVLRSNVNGRLAITQDGTRIPDSVIVREWVTEPSNGMGEPHTLFRVPIRTPRNGVNTFNIEFNPSPLIPPELVNRTPEGYVLASTTPMRRTFIMERREYHGGTGNIFVAPNGGPNNAGTRASPLDLQTAINFVQPGQDIVMLDGEYVMHTFLTIPRNNSGRHGAMKTLRAENRYMAAIDFKKNVRMKGPGGQFPSHGIMVDGSYWRLSGFHVRNAADNAVGVKIGGHNNIIEWLLVYNSGDTGIQITGVNTEPKRYWPSFNVVRFNTSFNNIDESLTNADGFAAKLAVGEGNRFEWNIAHNGFDDGWDLFEKKENGNIGVVRFFGNVVYNLNSSSWLSTRGGNRGLNAFKLGGEGLRTQHDVRHSITFNVNTGFTGNSNPVPQQYFVTAIGNFIGANQSGLSGNGQQYGINQQILAGIGNGARFNSIATNAVNGGTLFTNTRGGQEVLYTWAEAFPGVPLPPAVYASMTSGNFNWMIPAQDFASQPIFMKRLEDGRPAFYTDLERSPNVPGTFRRTASSQPVYQPAGPIWQPNTSYQMVDGNMNTGQLNNLPRGAWAFFVDGVNNTTPVAPDYLPW